MLLIYTIIYAIAMALYYLGLNIIASCITIALAIFLYIAEVIRSKRVIGIRGLFALGFIGGFGLSLLKLSNLSSTYSVMTFLVVYASYFSIYVGAFLFSKKERKEKQNIYKEVKIKKIEKGMNAQDILVAVLIIITFLSFVTEVILLGFIPALVKDTPHAYSTFHIFGLHYITTIYIFIPSIAVCNYFINDNKKNSIIILTISYIYMAIFALLMVSRAQLILSVILSIFTFIINKNDSIIAYINDRKYKVKKIKAANKKIVFKIFILIALIILFVGLYIAITISRAHNVAYLKDIFDMKNKDLPIFIVQPYMYIAHNFENLNYMINNTFRWTFGRRILYPFFTLTLIKKFFPIVVDSPYYIIKEELSTVTLVYDFYYDFGLVGVIVFCFIIGYVGKLLEDKAYAMIKEENFNKNNYITILFALYSYYMLFSFFQTYFSLTETWIYIIFLSVLHMVFLMTKKVPQKIAMQKQIKPSEVKINEDNQNKEL